MPSRARLTKDELQVLIDNVKNSGGDSTGLEGFMAEVVADEERQRPQRRNTRREQIRMAVAEEPTTEERLEAEVGELFLCGITGKILVECIEMDGKYTLAELKEMCVEAGLSPRGHKKELAAKLIARRKRSL